MNLKGISMLVGGSCLLVMTGCGTVDTRSTVEQLTNARIAVEAAEKAGAKTHSEENLRQAQDALAIAKDAYANKAFERAFDFSKKATIYARVATAQTDYKKSEKKLSDLQAELTEVRSKTQSLMNSAGIQQPEKKAMPSDMKSSSPTSISQPIAPTPVSGKTPAPAKGGKK